MRIYPAIDLQNGKCIRLKQGDYDQATIYQASPTEMIEQFANAGAEWVHIVDLDGAKNPDKNQSELICSLAKFNCIKIQTGGGIRQFHHAFRLFEHGIERIILGSIALANFNLVAEWFRYFGADRLVLALDIKFNEQNQAMVAFNAWQEVGKQTMEDVIDAYLPLGLKHVLCTNIHRDGMLGGPDIQLYQHILQQYPQLELQASGGVQSIADIKSLREAALSGAIIGRAIYENALSIQDALSC